MAGDAGEELAKSEDGVFHNRYFAETQDHRNALEIAEVISASPQETAALMSWLMYRTRAAVGNLWFRRMQDGLVPKLLEDEELTRDELIEILRPIAVDVLDLTPKTWRGRFRLRLARLIRRPRRWLRRPWQRIEKEAHRWRGSSRRATSS